MAEENNYKESKMIFKSANNRAMIVFDDTTDDYWRVGNKDDDGNKVYNNVKIKFIEYKNNKTTQYIPIFIDADELMAIMKTILHGTFSKILSPYKNYGGSHKCLSYKVNGDNKSPMVKGIESRIFSMYTNDGKLILQGESYQGKKTRNGAIQKQGDSVGRLFFSFSALDAVVMAQTILSYLESKKTLSISKDLKRIENKNKEGR